MNTKRVDNTDRGYLLAILGLVLFSILLGNNMFIFPSKEQLSAIELAPPAIAIVIPPPNPCEGHFGGPGCYK